jgi:hypothetical protein
MHVVPPRGAEPQPDHCTSLLNDLMAQPVWLLWRPLPNPDPTKKDLKVPCYASGRNRRGDLDGPEDRARLVTHAAAVAAYEQAAPGTYAGLGIALGPDGRGGCWQGVDLDSIVAANLTDVADLWTRGDCVGLGYVEASPSGEGLHILGYGRSFETLGANASGIEAYAGGRFFTFTGRPVLADSPCRSYDIAEYVEVALTPRHVAARPKAANDVGTIRVDAKAAAELRSALLYLRSDDRELWVNMGMALKQLGEVGRSMWTDWSATSDKFDPRDATRTWDSFQPRATGYKAVFAEAMRQGWPNPRDAEAVRHGAEVAADFERNAARPAVLLASDGFHDRTPLNFLKTASAPRLSTANLPAPIAEFASAYSAAHGFDVSGVIMAAIASAAAMIDDAYVLEAKPGWNISARIWTVLVGRSGSGKSPTVKAATRPVRDSTRSWAENTI